MKKPASSRNTSDASGRRKATAERSPPGTPNPVDIHVGKRLRLRRTLLGMSQERLGEAIGLTFQQVQKYERGVNRIGASRVFELSRVLDVPVSYFFEGLPDRGKPAEGGRHGVASDRRAGVEEAESMARRETLELVRAYYGIADPKVRKRLYELLKSVAGMARAA
jgi:transcriptional regulator with XRE-family HTH domain